MKKDYTRSNFIIFTCSVAMVIIITVLVFYFYKIDEASTVTVSNGETLIYNGVSFGDVVVATLSIIVTLILGVFTYTQNRITIDNETWDKTPFFEIAFESKKELEERVKEVRMQIQEVCDEEDMEYLNVELSELEERLSLYSQNHFFQKFLKAYKTNDEYKSYLEIPLKSINDINIFSVDIYEIVCVKRKYHKKYFSRTKDLLEEEIKEINRSYLIDENGKPIVNDKYSKIIAYYDNIINYYALPEIMGIEKGDVNVIAIPLESTELDSLIKGKPIRKIIGLDIKTTSNYTYNQVIKVNLMFWGECSDYQEIVCSVSSYDTEIVAGVLDDKKMKRAVDELIKKEIENIYKYK